MAKITPENIADLKALFQDNEKALGANFSQLIDFFNNNKVTDNGDGTFNVGAITVDASKLYDLINNSSPNILPLDNEFTGKNTFDIAPINKANGKPYITADSVPQPDLSNYATQQQLATKADTSAIDPSVMVKRTLTADDDVLTLADGIYRVWGVVPKNLPAISIGNGNNWGYITVKSIDTGARFVTFSNVLGNSATNILSGYPATWTGWRVPNANTMASKTDVTTAVSTATANMVDSSKPTNFTAGLQSGGVDVATAADLKSVEDQAWRPLKLLSSTGGTILFKDNGNGSASLYGSAVFHLGIGIDTYTAGIYPPEGYAFSSVDWTYYGSIKGILAQNSLAGQGSASIQHINVKIENNILLFGGTNSVDLLFLLTFNRFMTNFDSKTTAGDPAIIAINKLV